MITGDNPIKKAEDDLIGRNDVATEFARTVLQFDTAEGVVVGVLGPWGSWKTSFINLARWEFEKADVPVLDFNPWMFSGTAQLIESFFAELAGQLKVRGRRFARIGKFIASYGGAFSGILSVVSGNPWVGGLGKVLSKIPVPRKQSVFFQRRKLETALSNLEEPIVVVIDDVDRLLKSEIGEVFKLIRLTANFPNIIYILAFDRIRVENALDENGISGRAYLEKILQVAYDLPEVPGNILIGQISSALQGALANIENVSQVDEQVWPDVLMDIIRPLIRNMRDVRRYVATVHGTVKPLNGKIAVADLLALEAIRMFVPDVFKLLHGAIEGLTGSQEIESQTLKPKSYLQGQVDGLIEAAGDHRNVVESMIARIFPAAGDYDSGDDSRAELKNGWLRNRRVAHADILRFYLERLESDNLQAFEEAEGLWKHMADREAFDKCLRSLSPKQQQGVVASFELYEDQFLPEYVVPGTIVLLNLLPLPERDKGVFGFSPTITITRVVFRLLKCLDDSASIEAAVREILPELKSLSSKLELISMVGYQEGVGHKLVIEKTALEFEKAWREEVRSTSVNELATEYNLLGVLLRTKRAAAPNECPLKIDDSLGMTVAVLRASESEIIGQYLGSRAIQSKPRLHWNELIELYDDEKTLGERVQSLKIANLEGSHELIALAEKYLGGYRDEGSR